MKTRIIGVAFLSWLFIVLSLHHALAAETALQSGVPFNTWLNGMTYANAYIDVPEGATRLTVTITNGSGDLDLYLKFGSPATGGTLAELNADADARSNGAGASETIVLSGTTSPALMPGKWYVATLNLNNTTTSFTLTATVEVQKISMPLPAGRQIFSYLPAASAVRDTEPSKAKPVGVGPVAEQGDRLSIGLGLESFAGPVDIYGAFRSSSSPGTINVVNPDLSFKSFSFGEIAAAVTSGRLPEGALPLRKAVSSSLEDALFDMPLSAIPAGTYAVYLLVTPAGNPQLFYLWTTYFVNIPDGNAGFSRDKVIVPNATIIHNGQQFQNEAPVSGNALVGIRKNDKTYLYHPALGNAVLSEYTSRRAVGYFIAGVTSDKVQDLSRTAAADTKVLQPGETLSLATGLDLEIVEETGLVKATNKTRRWTAVTTDVPSLPYYLMPTGNSLPTDIVDALQRAAAGSLESLSSRDDIEAHYEMDTYGAVIRAYPSLQEQVWQETLASYQVNPALVLRLNAIDFTYYSMEGFKNFFGLVPLECVDALLSSGFINLMENVLMQTLIEEERPQGGISQVSQGWINDSLQSISGCLLEVVTLPSGIGPFITEVVYSFLDIMSAVQWVIEDSFENYVDTIFTYSPYQKVAINPVKITNPSATGNLVVNKDGTITVSCTAKNAISVIANLSSVGGPEAFNLTSGGENFWTGSIKVKPPAAGAMTVTFIAEDALANVDSAQTTITVKKEGTMTFPLSYSGPMNIEITVTTAQGTGSCSGQAWLSLDLLPGGAVTASSNYTAELTPYPNQPPTCTIGTGNIVQDNGTHDQNGNFSITLDIVPITGVYDENEISGSGSGTSGWMVLTFETKITFTLPRDK